MFYWRLQRPLSAISLLPVATSPRVNPPWAPLQGSTSLSVCLPLGLPAQAQEDGRSRRVVSPPSPVPFSTCDLLSLATSVPNGIVLGSNGTRCPLHSARYGLNCVAPEKYAGVLTSSTSDVTLFGNQVTVDVIR